MTDPGRQSAPQSLARTTRLRVLRMQGPTCRPTTTRLVEVPMDVHVPPSTAAYDSGMSSFLGGTPQRRLQEIRMGICSHNM